MNTDPTPPSPTEPALILVVEDEPSLRQAVCEALRLDGFEPVEAASLSDAETLIRNRGTEFDGVLLDLLLEDGMGESLLDTMSELGLSLPVVVASGRAEEDLVLRCLNKGGTDFIAKPFQMKGLLIALRRSMRRHGTLEVKPEDMEAVHATTGWVELTAPSDFEFLIRMQRFSQILFSSHLPRAVAEDLRVTMEEMGRNAIEWGNRFDKQKQFRISYCFFKDRVVLKFEDEGEGFIPENLPDPAENPQKHLEERMKDGKRPGGFGVYLVQSIMDEVVYSDRGNVVLMTKFLPEDE